MTNENLITDVSEIPIVLDAKILKNVLRVSSQTVYNLLHSDDFPTIKIGRRMVVSKEAFLEWLNSAPSIV